MLGTIETTNNNIVTKLNSIHQIMEIFKSNEINIGIKIIKDVEDLKEEYEMGSINILAEYFNISNSYETEDDKNYIVKLKKRYFYNYQVFIRKENIISKLDRSMNLIKKYIQNNKFTKELLKEIYTFIKSYNNSTIDKNVKEIVYELCTCLKKMDIDSVNSMLVCKSCGMSKELYGTVFEDDQFYYQEGQRTKHGTYDPSKHCRFWVERIQARETTDIDESVIKNIKKCIQRDKIRNKNQITCNQIRIYLRQTHNSKYNEHVPLIRKLITGISPPQLTDYEMQLIHIYFDKVIHIFDDIKPPEKTNCPYHPYFIYKIIEQILKKPPDRIRKCQILACIHLQSTDTLVNNDLLWRPICDKIKEFSYKPTDRNDQFDEF
jgi:hypothetical protein